MSLLNKLREKCKGSKTRVNEPKFHPSVEHSYLYTPTAGQRPAADFLVLELFRELFFDPRFSSDGEVQLRPDSEEVRKGSSGDTLSGIKAVIFSLRGRQKKTRQSSFDQYYTPAYPSLAEFAWLRPQTDRVIKNFLFGALSQYFSGSPSGKEAELAHLPKLLISALIGSKDDILIASIGTDLETDMMSVGESEETLRTFICDEGRFFKTWENDPLAERIYRDLVALGELEHKLPRLQWIELLKAFIRLSTSTWLLAQFRHTEYVLEWLLGAMLGSSIPSDEEVQEKLRQRSDELLRPTTIPNLDVEQHIIGYMRSRVELNILLHLLDLVGEDVVAKKKLTAVSNGSANELSISELCTIARDLGTTIKDQIGDIPVDQFVRRRAEDYPAWLDPIKRGQGKNYGEFLQVLWKSEEGDESGSYLLTPVENTRKGQRKRFVIFPGQLMLKLFVFLADYEHRIRPSSQRVVLGEVERHMAAYGLSFGSSDEARTQLIESLQRMGLLISSPDAGEYVAISAPYDIEPIRRTG